MFHSCIFDSISNQEERGGEMKDSAVCTDSKSTEKSMELW